MADLKDYSKSIFFLLLGWALIIGGGLVALFFFTTSLMTGISVYGLPQFVLWLLTILGLAAVFFGFYCKNHVAKRYR